ncbi:MAG: glycosyltransferase family 39 protein [Candidatus Hydrogenedentes bacterium]|nr:glycosyltransferase family 39 protein [Candidatus Hydrogenedentota bacterium]
MTNRNSEDSAPIPAIVPWALIGLGLLFRVVQYAHYRTLWSDEAWYAASMVEMSPLALFGPLQYGGCVAPPGYLIGSKWLIGLLGMNEYIVRLPSLVGGLLVLFLFYPVAKKLLSPRGAVLALAFVAFCPHLIYYSTEVRQYSTDAAAVVVLLWLALHFESQPLSWGEAAVFALAAAIIPWFSMTSVFVLAAIVVTHVLRSDLPNKARWLAAHTVWMASFAALYVVSIAPISRSANMANMLSVYTDAGAFLPLLPRSASDVKWLRDAFLQVFDNPAGFSLPAAAGLAGFAFLLGCVSLFLRRKPRFLLVILPFVFVLAASALHRYPFYKRTILFLVPLIFLVLGEGVAYLAVDSRKRWPIGAILLFALLIVQPAYRAARVVAQPTTHHELNRLLDYAQTNWRPGDLLCVPHLESLSFRFCNWRYGFKEEEYTVMAPPPTDKELRKALWTQELGALRDHARVWIPMVYDDPGVAKPLLDVVDASGRRLDEFHAMGASIYLTDLSQTSASKQTPAP